LLSGNQNISNNIIVTNARARLPLNDISAIYFDVINNTENDLNIISVNSDLVAEHAFLRNSYIDIDGVARTTNLQRILLPKNTKILFKPQGIHIDLSNFKRKFNIGDKFQIILQFDNNAIKPIEVTIIDFKNM
jgi:copper(I)-binding protein